MSDLPAAASIRAKLLGAAAFAIVCVAALLLVVARARHVVIEATAQMNRAVAALDTLSDAKAEGRLIPIRLRELQLAENPEAIPSLLGALVLYGNQTTALLGSADELVDGEMRRILQATSDDLSLLIAGAALLSDLRREMLETRDRDLLQDGEALERRIARVSHDLFGLATSERDLAADQADILRLLAVDLRLSGGRILAGSRQGARRLAAKAQADIVQAQRVLETLPPSPQAAELKDIAHAMSGFTERFQRLLELIDTVTRVDAEALTPRRLSYEAALDRVFQRQRDSYAAAMTNLEEATRRSKSYLVALALVSCAAIVALLFGLHRTVVRPLLGITDALRHLAIGTRDVHVPHAARADEIGELARAAERFREALVEVEDARTKVEKALEIEREAHEQRKRFVSIASHEFRTPLAIIDGAAQRLVQARTPDAVAARADRIRTAVGRMVQLIDRTLYAARLENGRIQLNLAEIDLIRIVDNAVRRQREIRRDFVIDFDRPATALRVNGDAQLLEQVFQNLLSNAVKYSGRSTRVSVSAAMEGGNAVVRVADRGIGIPAEEMPQLFQRFFRASTARGIAGTGIGLNFVKDLVEMHGGVVEVESMLAKGSVFIVRLPLVAAATGRQNDALTAA